MPTIDTSSESIEQSQAPSTARKWVMAIGGIIIAVQLAVLGSVLNGQVEQAGARQAALASAKSPSIQVTSTSDLRPGNLAQ
jgi:hypothetical protein